jgi:hypothetical protein
MILVLHSQGIEFLPPRPESLLTAWDSGEMHANTDYEGIAYEFGDGR